MSHIVLLPFGSAGDVFPFIWLGKLLMARGHRVTMISTCMFSEAAEAAGIDFVPLGTIEEIEAITKDRRIWKLGIGTKVVLDYAVEWSDKYLAACESLEDVDLMMAPLTAFGARMAREKHGIPLITVHLQPLVLVSAYETPLLHPLLGWFQVLPVWLKKLLFSLPNAVDLLAMPGIRKICRKNGVIPPKSLCQEWWDSPDGVLVLFPEWFGKPQPDWPVNYLQWDFPMEDLTAEVGMQTELSKFFAAGEKPVVFTPGSANVQAEKFFATAAETVKRLAIRAVFVTRMDNQIPAGMAGSILQVDFVPFSKLLNHASAFVHHGGVGTMAQGFRAGVPQLIMAMSHDQPDNAGRLEKLGAGIGIMAREFTPERVTKELAKLLGDRSFADAAEVLKSMTEARRDVAELVGWIECRVPGDQWEGGGRPSDSRTSLPAKDPIKANSIRLTP
jgi:rhamnosyltransferase subunit B